jgi:hypothetical protein
MLWQYICAYSRRKAGVNFFRPQTKSGDWFSARMSFTKPPLTLPPVEAMLDISGTSPIEAR